MPNLPLAIAVGAIGGAGSGIAFTPWFSLLQRMTPDRDRGTAFAMAETFEQTSFVAGMVAAGALISTVGVQPTYLVSGLLLAWPRGPPPVGPRRSQSRGACPGAGRLVSPQTETVEANSAQVAVHCSHTAGG